MKNIFAITMLLLSTTPLRAATYFVSSSGGSNANAGTSSGSPWQTLAKVQATTLNADDVVQLKRGDTWHERLVISNSGTSGHPIIVQDYGSGPLPIVDGADVVSSWTNTSGNVWQISYAVTPHQVFRNGTRAVSESSQGALVANYEFFYNSGTTTLYVYTTTNPNSDSSTWEAGSSRYGGVFINGASYITVNNLNVINISMNSASAGINFDAIGTALAGETVTNSVVSNCWDFGIQFYTGGGGSFNVVTVTGTSVDHSYIEAGGESDLELGLVGGGSLSNVTLTNDHFSYGGVHGDPSVPSQQTFGVRLGHVLTATLTNIEADHNGTSGIGVQDGSNGITISGGSSHDNGLSHVKDCDGIGLGGIGNGSSNITVTGMDVYNNFHSAIEIASTDTNQILSNVTIEYNRLRGSTAADGNAAGLKVGGGHTGQVYMYNLIYGNSDYGFSTTEGSSGDPAVFLYGNTIYGNGTGGVNTANVFVNANALTMKNNIVAQATGQELVVQASNTYTSDYNDFYHAAGGNFISYYGTAYSFAGYKTAATEDAHSISSNTNFTNPGVDFTLMGNSPALGSGVSLGSTYQNALVPSSSWPGGVRTAPQATLWDIGAFIIPIGVQIGTGTNINSGVSFQ